jgi:flavin reductase (DIM6/NTAB) family NADH-FMN oxidoreductase RutF
LIWKNVDIRDVERLLYPVKPTVVTAGAEGRVGGMLAAWWTQLSFSPFLVGVAVAPERFTYRLLSESNSFGLNFLDFKYVDKMPYLGDVSERFMHGKLEKAGFSIVRGEKLGVPLIGEASAALELEKFRVIEMGDHDFFVGKVVAAYAVDDFRDGMWKLEGYSPLFYLGRTRRPAKVQRFYLGLKTPQIRALELAGGELKKYFEERISFRSEIEAALKDEGTIEEKIKTLEEIVRKKGLDFRDLELLVEDAIRGEALEKKKTEQLLNALKGLDRRDYAKNEST